MSRKSTLISTIVCSGVISLMRILEGLFIIEAETGFYKPGFGWFGLVSGFVSFVLIAVLVYFCGISTNIAGKLKSPGVGISIWSFAVAGSLLAVVVKSFINNMSISSFSALSLATSVISIVAMAYFLLYGLKGFIGFSVPKYLAVFLVPLWLYRLIYCFLSIREMSHISDNVYTIVMFCACTVFFLFMSKAVSDVGVKNSLSVAVPVGLASSVLCFVCTVPRFVIWAFGGADMLHENPNVDVFIFFTGIFIIAFVLKAIRNSRQKNKRVYNADNGYEANSNGGDSVDAETTQPIAEDQD